MLLLAIDHCQSNPCKHGDCTSSPEGYVCDCDKSWEGTNCDQKGI